MEENVKLNQEVENSAVATLQAGEVADQPTETAENESTVAQEVSTNHNSNGNTNGNGSVDHTDVTPLQSADDTAQEQTEPTQEVQTSAEPEATLEPAVEAAPTAETTPSNESEVAEPAEPPRPTSLMEQLLNESSSSFKTLHYGEVIDGVVMHKDRDEILVDIGAKSEGIVPNKEVQTLTPDEMGEIKLGEQILVFVIQPENQEGHAILSIDKAKMEKSWRRLQKQFEAEEIIEAEVTGYNKGGLLVNLEGVRGFVPSSQVTGLATGNEAAKQSEMTRLVNSKLPLKIIEINRNRNRLILSERLAAQVQRDFQKDRLMSELEKGQIRDGIVTSICDFGAFVDIGGADGLVHLSELSWSRVNHPNEVLKVSDKVKVYVLEVNPDDKKVALSIKRTQPEPWSQVMANYQPGQLVEGTITQLANFGAFARIANGIEGLIHVSELAEGRVQHPRNVVKEGDVVTLRIIRIDPQRKRMGLSLKRAAEGYEGSLADLPEDDEISGGGRPRNGRRQSEEAEEAQVGSGAGSENVED